MNDTTEATQTLRAFFQQHLATFPLQKQQHFAERMYRVFGDTAYFPQMKSYIESVRSQFEQYQESIGSMTTMEQLGAGLLAELESRLSYNTRLAKRFPFFHKHPEYLALQDYIWHINKFAEYGAIDPDQKEACVQSLKSIDFRSYFFDADFIAVDPVQTTNTVYLLAQLGVIDLVDDFTSFAKSILTNKDEHGLVNLLYFFTHGIISDSLYYQRFVDEAHHRDAFDAFQSNIDAVLQLTNTDVIAEIGVCYKLARREDESYQRVFDHITTTLARNDGILPIHGVTITDETRYKLEHRNILALMLLSPFDQLRSGPKIF